MSVHNLFCDLERKGTALFSQQDLAYFRKNQREIELWAHLQQAASCTEANANSDLDDADFDFKGCSVNAFVRTENRVFFDNVFNEMRAEIFSTKQVVKLKLEIEEQLRLYQKNFDHKFGLVSFGGTIGSLGVPIEVSILQFLGIQKQSRSTSIIKQQCFVDISDILLPCSVVVSEHDLLTLQVLRKVAYRMPSLSGQISSKACFTAPYFELLWGTESVATICFGSERDADYVTCIHMFVPKGVHLSDTCRQKIPNYRVVEWHFDNKQVRCNFSVDKEYLLFEKHGLVVGVGESTFGVKILDDPFSSAFNAKTNGRYHVSLEQLGYVYNSYCVTFSFLPVTDFTNQVGCKLYGVSA